MLTQSKQIKTKHQKFIKNEHILTQLLSTQKHLHTILTHI